MSPSHLDEKDEQARKEDVAKGERCRIKTHLYSLKGILQIWCYIHPMHFFYLIVSFSSKTNVKDTTNPFQKKLIKPNVTMPTLVLDLESSSMCCYLALVERLIDQ